MPKIRIGDAKLFFDVYSSQLTIQSTAVVEKPTLLVLHGGHGMVDHSLYVEFWSQFADIAQVIFLDQRGCGRSDWRDAREWNLCQWAQDVYDFCQALSIEKPIVAGVSMGGHVICEYATRYPDHPGALIFCNTEAKMDVDLMAEKFELMGGKEIGDLCRQNYLAPTPEIVKAYKERCVPYYAHNAYTATEIKRCRQHLEVFEHYCKHEAMKFNYLNELYKIKSPSLFMVGEDSPGHPPATAYEMTSKMDSALVTFLLFVKAGAAVYKDSPEEAKQVVRDFIESKFGE